MTDRIRVLIALTRPPVLVLLGLFGMLGLVQGGVTDDTATLTTVLTVIAGFLLYSVAINDLADEAIDRVNLPANASRPLVTGTGTRTDMPVVAATAAIVAIAAAAILGTTAIAIVVAGLALSTAYSLPPIRLSGRGAVASMLLPAGYVAVPFLVGRLALGEQSAPLDSDDAFLLAGLYVGFIGRILLKDFRDVNGDALFGKRTFLVRYGRSATCATSAAAWVLGSFYLLGVRDLAPSLVASHIALLATALVLLRELAADKGARHDEWVISAIAIVGRAMVLAVIAHLGMTVEQWPTFATNALTLALTTVMIGQASTMVRNGPRHGTRVPTAWMSEHDQEHEPELVATPR